ncbi:MAG: hypothetical protein ABI193_17670 [Minicystis sp.]
MAPKRLRRLAEEAPPEIADNWLVTFLRTMSPEDEELLEALAESDRQDGLGEPEIPAKGFPDAHRDFYMRMLEEYRAIGVEEIRRATSAEPLSWEDLARDACEGETQPDLLE